MELNVIAEFLVDKLREELTNQDHRASGKLIDTMRYEVDGNNIKIYAKHYAEQMENGLPKESVVPISALIRWIEIRGIAQGDQEVKSVAFAIHYAIMRQGSPTRGAFKFTYNGRRKGFVEFVINTYNKEILKMASVIFTNQVNLTITNGITNNGIW